MRVTVYNYKGKKVVIWTTEYTQPYDSNGSFPVKKVATYSVLKDSGDIGESKQIAIPHYLFAETFQDTGKTTNLSWDNIQ